MRSGVMTRVHCPVCQRPEPVTGHGRCLICGCPITQAQAPTGNLGYLIKRQLLDNAPIAFGVLLVVGSLLVQVTTGFGFGWFGMVAVALVGGGSISWGLKNRYS